jgi:hypothetical protein
MGKHSCRCLNCKAYGGACDCRFHGASTERRNVLAILKKQPWDEAPWLESVYDEIRLAPLPALPESDGDA